MTTPPKNRRTPSAQFGIHTFGEVTTNAAATVREVVDQAVLAERVGLDFVGLGEHHRPDFAISQPELILAAIAAGTSRIRIGTAVTVLSADDPIRVYERLATLAALSSGRAELTVGPGAFRDMFDLFDVPFERRKQLFNEKVGTLLDLIRTRELTPAAEGSLVIRVATSGSAETLEFAAWRALPIVLAAREGDPVRYAPAIDAYIAGFRPVARRRADVTVHLSGYVGSSLERARDEAWPYVQEVMRTLGSERGWDAVSRQAFLEGTEPDGPLLIGPPAVLAHKIARIMRELHASRFALKYSLGPMPDELLSGSVRRFGEEVVPRVRELLAPVSDAA